MSDLLIRNIGGATKEALKARAARHGRSLSEEARSILQSKMAEVPPVSKGWGTLMVERAQELQLTDEERRMFEEAIAEVRAEPQRPPPFGE